MLAALWLACYVGVTFTTQDRASLGRTIVVVLFVIVRRMIHSSTANFSPSS